MQVHSCFTAALVPLQHLAAFGRASTLLLGLVQSPVSNRNTAQRGNDTTGPV